MSGFWSNTFGGGNSFSESVANVTTPGDGYSYKGGTLYEGDSTVPYTGPNTATNYGTLGQADSQGTGSKNFYQNVTSSGDTRSSTAQSGPANVPAAEQGTRTTTMQRVIPGLALGAAGFGPLAMGAAMYRGLGSNQYGVPEFKSPNGEYATTQDEIDRAVAKANATKMTTAGMGEGKSFFGGKRGPDGYTSDIRTAGEPHDRIRGAFFKKDDPSGRAYKINAFGNSYEVDTDGQNIGNSSQIRRDAEAAALPDDGGVAGLRYTPRTQATVPTSTMPAMSDMSREAAAGANMPIPNPNYDPNDPTSMKYIINPSYDQIVAYKRGLPGYTPVEPDSNMSAEMIQAIKNGTLGKVFGYAEGGEVESALGGNEKDLINDAEKAIRGELDETRAAIILAQYVQQYGEGALMNLVDSIRTGEADKTRAQFASGKNGMVRGNGDGSGVDDMVTAQLKDGDSTQDVLLADGEFVMRKDATDSLQKAYGDGMLDKINDAGPNAAAALKKYLTG